MTGSRGGVEPVDDDRYRVRFGKPIEAEVALMYFGFYPDVRLFWKDGRVVSVVARWLANTFCEGKISIGQHRRDK